MISFFLALWWGKLIFFLSRRFGLGGGSAAPGLYALKIYPQIITRLSSQIKNNVIITGTNGKTTTSKLIEHFAKASNLKTIRNKTGSNLKRGVASALIYNANIFGQIKNVDLGIWELDEAAFNTVFEQLNPSQVTFLNVFRDQLDRYGEIDNVIKKWSEAVRKLKKEATIFLNGDDANLYSLDRDSKPKAVLFGVDKNKISGEFSLKSQNQQKLDYEARDIEFEGLEKTKFKLDLDGIKIPVMLPLPGIYHVYDFLAAFANGIALSFSPQNMVDSLKNYKPAFGRMEKISLESSEGSSRPDSKNEGYIFLIKNPAGASQIFETIKDQIMPSDRLLVVLNDNLADGTDVSWIWDARFEALKTNSKYQIFCSGTRAYDLSLRLKYAGLEPSPDDINTDLKESFRKAKSNLKGRLFILPTYTALLELQAILVKAGVKKHYWKE